MHGRPQLHGALTVRPGRLSAALAVAIAGSAIVGCGAFRSPASFPVGTTLSEARGSLGGANGTYPLPAGGTRLEFDRGKATYMLDFDATGTLVSSAQVLTPPNFGAITEGMPEADVLARIGHPAFAFGVGHPPTSIWNYRFGGLEGDCVVMQVAIGDSSRRVESVSPNTDPACDHGGDRD